MARCMLNKRPVLQVVQHVLRKAKLRHRVYAVGFSAGSNCLTKYVSGMGSRCPLSGAASVANGYDIKVGLEHVAKKAWMLDRCDALH
jgi:predicted alpha/beta-fold hydrolase